MPRILLVLCIIVHPLYVYAIQPVSIQEQEGIPIAAITLQNEPEYEAPTYPSLLMSPEVQADFVKNDLGPAFEENNIDTKILVYDHNWDLPNYPISVLHDAEARKYVDGVAFHCYNGEVHNMSQVHEAYPEVPIYFTECSGGGWAPGFANTLKWFGSNLIIGNLRNWATSVILWNLALDQHSGPTNHGCLDCRRVITVDSNTKAVTKNVEYYVLGHVSKFVRPGAKRIASSEPQSDVQHVALQNEDGSIALVVLNGAASDKKITVKMDKKAFSYTLKAGALYTFFSRQGE